MKLHLGCGKRNFGPDWIHIDAGNYQHLHSHDITILPFNDNSCDIVYASHVAEYFDRHEIIGILREWKRVLKLNGVLRLAVPDFEAIVKLYFAKMTPLKNFLGPMYGRMIPSGADKPIYHKTIYDFISLKFLLESIGFMDVRKYDNKSTDHSNYDDHSFAYFPHMDFDNGTLLSLNVEANKSDNTEIWIDVPDYENTYQVSNFGRVKRVGGKILNPGCGSNGYLRVSLSKNSKVKQYLVHQLVAISFLGNKPFPDAQVRHLDDKKHNNHLVNIKWGTRSENMKDREKNNICNNGSRNGQSKLKECCVQEIRRLLAKNIPSNKIAQIFGVHRTTIVDIKNNRTWRPKET